MAQQTGKHRWRFFRAGGFDQVRLDTGADLLALDQLDQKLWVALACPTTSIDVDPRTLSLLDLDGDKRVRANELVSAAKWVGALLRNPDDLVAGRGELSVSQISTATEEGKALAHAAARVLRTLGKDPETECLTVAEASDAVKALHASPFNGDGVIVEKGAGSDELAAAIRDLVACYGGDADRSGALGVNQKQLAQFFTDAAAYLAWHEAGQKDAATAPLPKTAAARSALTAVQPKLDDYFARCRLAAFDARATGHMNRDEKDYVALALKELTLGATEVAAFPVAHVAPKKPLPLASGINPAWEKQVHAFAAEVVTPLFGSRDGLTEEEWATIKTRFAAFDAWQAAKQGAAVEKLGADRIRALCTPAIRDGLQKLIEEDLAVEPVAKAVGSLEKLVRLHRDLFRLANNFVSFRDFYARREKAVFQAGTLFIDQRSCDLCIRVEDAAKHALMAPLSRAYLAYCECTRDGKKQTIVAAFTAGNSDNLMVGRNGLFYDRAGLDWDATITKVVDNPINVRQAFWSPYKKVIRFIEEQSAKRAADADAASSGKLTNTAGELGTAIETGKPKEAPAKIDIGMVAAIGVAVGGLTAALGVMMQAFFGLGLWMPLGFIALLLAISVPSMAVAWLKLRQRNLGPLLDASGWAINAAARINIPFGASLTQVAVLPPNSSRDLRDPYAEKSTPWPALAAAACLLAMGWFWGSGSADPYLPESAKRAHIFPSTAVPPAQQLVVSPPAPSPLAPPSAPVVKDSP